jgi:hypothetical protein
MAAKGVSFSDEARRAVKATLGPRGRHAALRGLQARMNSIGNQRLAGTGLPAT